MKIYILFSTIFLALSFGGNAQKKSVEYGFHAGINFNSSHGSSLLNDKTSLLPGYNVGSHIKLNITNHLGIKVILLYEQNGWAYRSLAFENSNGTGLAQGDASYKLDYLNLPLLAEYQVGNKIKFNCNTGVFVGALLKNQLKINIQDQTSTESSSNIFKLFNYGISMGIGTQIPIGRKIKLNFDLRNNIGLANLNKSQGSSQSTQKTKSISISSGLTFRM